MKTFILIFGFFLACGYKQQQQRLNLNWRIESRTMVKETRFHNDTITTIHYITDSLGNRVLIIQNGVMTITDSLQSILSLLFVDSLRQAHPTIIIYNQDTMRSNGYDTFRFRSIDTGIKYL